MPEPKPVTDYPGMIHPHVAKLIKREQEVLEEMCERMLTTPGSPGISVQRTWKGLTCTTEVRLDPEVPFGTIGYYPDRFEPDA